MEIACLLGWIFLFVVFSFAMDSQSVRYRKVFGFCVLISLIGLSITTTIITIDLCFYALDKWWY